MDVGRFASDVIFPVITPGHSQHHVSYNTENYLFAGEACGVCFSLSLNRGDYMRPATPPRFFLDVTVKSIDDLIAIDPKKICFSHFGIKDDAKGMLTAHKQQLLLWEELISTQMPRIQEEDFLDTCIAVLLKFDPLMAGFSKLDESVQKREKSFIHNSIKGFVGYLKTVGNNP
jgi:glyoxylase-like metal-dependent hydrolase (beta-lactamase superfamily II)